MLESSPARSGADDRSLEKRVRQEVQAALGCADAKTAAAHVELANRYLTKLNSSLKTSDPV